MLRLNLTNRDNTMNGTRKLVIRTRPIGDVFQQGGRSYEVMKWNRVTDAEVVG